MPYTPITALPDAPSRTEPSTFSTKADALVAALAGFVTETNAAGTYIDGVGTAVDADATAAAASATAAEAAETNALSAANFKGDWDNLTGALNIPASVFHDDAYWMLVSNLADVTAKEPGVDPEWTFLSNATAGSPFNSVQVFTSSGTWTKPTGITKVLMFVTGGGGAVEDSAIDYPGGAGGTAIKLLDVSSIASSTITVGAGGTSSGNGGNSSWSDGTNTITGGGGIGSSTPSGGTATGGDLNITGGRGPAPSGSVGGASFWGGYGAYGSGGAAIADLYDGLAGVVFILEFK